jgi:hypothetical protein
MVPITTPTKPTAAAGMASVITPAITATNNAKKYHALAVRPAGGGISAMITPARTGIIPFNIRVLFVPVIFHQDGASKSYYKKFFR